MIGNYDAGVATTDGNTGITVTFGQWYHVVTTWDGSTVNVYVDGNLEVTYNVSGLTFANYPMRFGASSDGAHYRFNGELEDVRFYNKALTQAEVTALYNNRGGIKIKTPDDSSHGFLEGDLIKAQRFTGNGVYVSDAVVTSVKGPKEFYVEPLNLANPSLELPQKGFEYVGVGNIHDDTRQGSVLLASEGVGAPYVDVIDGVTSFAK